MSGEVDVVCLLKEVYFVCVMMWVEELCVYIVGYWLYFVNMKKNVYVVSNVECVEFFVNGCLFGV